MLVDNAQFVNVLFAGRNANARNLTNERKAIMIGLLRVLTVVWKVAKVAGVLLDILPVTSTIKLWNAKKRIKQTEQVLEAVITGVESGDSLTVKNMITKAAMALAPKVELRLNRMVKRITGK